MQQYSSGARPKRDRHPPRHLDDYELDYPRGKPRNTHYSSTVPYEHGHEYHHLEGAAKMTSLTPPNHSPYRIRGKRDQEEQYSSFGFYQELETIREENTRLREAQLAIYRDFGQLHSLRKDMRSLVDSVRSLQEAQAATVSHAPIRPLDLQPGSGEWPDYIPPPVQAPPSVGEQYEEDDWPEPPPPWPEPEEQRQRNKVAHILDQVSHLSMSSRKSDSIPPLPLRPTTDRQW